MFYICLVSETLLTALLPLQNHSKLSTSPPTWFHTVNVTSNMLPCYLHHLWTWFHIHCLWPFKCICKVTSIHFLTSPLLSYSPLVHMYFSHTFVLSPGTTPKADDFPNVDSLKVIDFLLLPLLIPQQHQMSLGCIRTGLCDTMAPSTVMWMAIYRRLGTVILSISFVVGPSQGSLERSIWISPD
jgi:hypothetical protein